MAVLAALALLLGGGVALYLCWARWRHVVLNRSCRAAFERIFTADPKPKYRMFYSYSVPVFRIAFASQSAYVQARQAGHTESFTAAIQDLCQHYGSRERPYEAARAVEFSCEA
jgi:hypothetical protein